MRSAPDTSDTNVQQAPLLDPIAQRRLPDVIADQILAAIRNGALQPGDRLPTEVRLARQLGVGRTSVREGLQKLQTLGIVEVAKGRGSFVRKLAEDDARSTFARWSVEHRFDAEDLLEVRMALEAAAAAFAAARVSKDELGELEERHAAHVTACGADDLEGAVRSDALFHEAIIATARNKLLAKLYAMFVSELTDFRRQTLALPRSMQRSVAGHDAILKAISNRNPLHARTAMIEHLWVLYREVHETALSASDKSSRSSETSPAPREAFG